MRHGPVTGPESPHPSSTRQERPPKKPRPGPGAVMRSSVGATGAVLGTYAAVQIGPLLFAYLFTRVGKPVMNDIIGGSRTEGFSGLEAVLVGIFVFIGAVVVAILVVCVLVAPVFLLLPMAATAIALRLAGAGLIVRTLWLMLGTVAVLAVVVQATYSALEVSAFNRVDSGVAWALMVGVGAFVGRLVVEFWKPVEAAGR